MTLDINTDDDIADALTENNVAHQDVWRTFINTTQEEAFEINITIDKSFEDDSQQLTITTFTSDSSIYETRHLTGEQMEVYTDRGDYMVMSRIVDEEQENEYFAKYNIPPEDIFHHLRADAMPFAILFGSDLTFSETVTLDDGSTGLKYTITSFADTADVDTNVEETLINHIHHLDTTEPYTVEGTITFDTQGLPRDISYTITQYDEHVAGSFSAHPTDVNNTDVEWIDTATDDGMHITNMTTANYGITFTIENGVIEPGWSILLSLPSSQHHGLVKDTRFQPNDTVYVTIADDDDNTLHISDTMPESESDQISADSVGLTILDQNNTTVYMNSFAVNP